MMRSIARNANANTVSDKGRRTKVPYGRDGLDEQSGSAIYSSRMAE